MPPKTIVRLSSGLLTLVVLLAAGCGSVQTRTVTTISRIAAAKKVGIVHKSPSKRTLVEHVCTEHLTVNAHASCSFAENVLSAYASATNEEHGVTTLGVESPATGKTYSVACISAGYHRVGCTTTDARVIFNWTEVENARKHQSPSESSSTTGLWGVQSQAENEEAGCKYGFTMSGETPHCNTQEEGARLQETFQREREDPQREAENAQAGAEVQSHEECVDQLGVGAC